MGEKTKIEWCDSTVNPTMGCDGCELSTEQRKICYAGVLHNLRKNNSGFAPSFGEVTVFPGRMKKATQWSDLSSEARSEKPWLDELPRMIFVSDMSDALSKAVSFEFLRDEIIWQVLNENGAQHRWLWLTKRPEQMSRFSQWLRQDAGVHWPTNLWVGTSVTTQQSTSRIHNLLKVGNDHTTRFVSVEPQWEPIRLSDILPELDWVIQGGESGTVKHPFDVARVDTLRDECQEANVPYFLKQPGCRTLFVGGMGFGRMWGALSPALFDVTSTFNGGCKDATDQSRFG